MSHGPRGRGAMFADKKRSRSTKALLKIFWGFLEDDKNKLFLITIIIVFYTIASIYQPIIIQRAIDQFVTIDDTLSLSIINADILQLVMIFFGLSFMVWFLQSLNTWFTATLSTGMVDRIRKRSFKQLVDADMRYHHMNQSGEVTSRVINDTQEIATGLTVFTSTSAQLLLIVGTFAVLINLSIYFALISLLAIPIAWFLTKFISTIGRRRMLAVRQAIGRTSGKLAENLSGVMIAKSFNQEKKTSADIRKLNYETYGHMKSLGLVFMIMMPLISSISILLTFGVVIIGGFLSVTEIGMTIGSIYLGTVMVQRFLMPIIQLSNSFTQLQASLAALDRLVDIIEQEPEVKDSIEAVNLVVDRGEIDFNHVSFAYSADQVKKMKEQEKKEQMKKAMMSGSPRGMKEMDAKPNPEMMKKMKEMSATSDHAGLKKIKGGSHEEEIIKPKLVLKDVTFTIPAGQKWALVGHTGAGKTTITNLLMRFYDPNEGVVSIDGQDLRNITIDSLYETISLVSQEPYLFASTILENIRYGKPSATDDEIYEMCKLIGADKFIKALPNSYDTLLSESGKSLSAGQRQMITIARTMLSDPKILVLDEATSRLDALSESLVQIAQNKLFEGRTTLIIAHRLSTIRDVNKIIAMEDGNIVEIGTHDELMKNQSVYYKLYNLYYRHQGLEITP
ncbi:MAG: ABC transporter ATP-binding protein [Candidatus Heimdallarchaeota archaeon]|nr:ABC transporter ATP-binding protein [Candidatus Heimdallarchaeota archaeon]